MPESNVVFGLFQRPVLNSEANVICPSGFHKEQIRKIVDGEVCGCPAPDYNGDVETCDYCLGTADPRSMAEAAEDLDASVYFIASVIDWSIACCEVDEPVSVVLDGCPVNLYSRLVATLRGNGTGQFEPRFTTPGQMVPMVSSEGYLFEG